MRRSASLSRLPPTSAGKRCERPEERSDCRRASSSAIAAASAAASGADTRPKTAEVSRTSLFDVELNLPSSLLRVRPFRVNESRCPANRGKEDGSLFADARIAR